MKQPMIDTMVKEKYDNLYTPKKAVYPLVRLIYKKINLRSKLIVWEPCDDGRSLISSVLRQEYQGFEVISTSIVTGQDFLNWKPDFEFDLIVTNPPYSLKDHFIERCYELRKPFALLLPLTSLEGVHRGNLFRTYGINLMVLDRRLDFTGKKSNWFNASWFYWKIGPDENKIRFEEL